MKITHFSKKEILKRFDAGDMKMILDFYAKGKSVIIMTSHYGNWEWGSSFSLGLPPDKPVYNIYKQLKNKEFNKLMLNLRSSFDGKNIEKKELLRKMVELRKKQGLACFALISDQAPRVINSHYWTTFLNQDTAVIDGAEQLAKKFNYPVMYYHINRVKRGYYKCDYRLITDDPSNTKEFEITEKFIRILEEKIIEEPAYWLWSHNRWRRKKGQSIK